jgi:hypothetical protein
MEPLLLLIFILVGLVFLIFWVIQFSSLMEMSDDEFVGHNDKLIWALAMLIAGFIGALLFWLTKSVDVRGGASENKGMTNEEIEVLLGSMDRYKNLAEQCPQYKEYFVLTATMPKLDRENIEKLYIKRTTEKLKRKYNNGPASMANGAYGILITELIRREIDIAEL